MKKIAVLSLAALIFSACGGANQTTVNTNVTTKTAPATNNAPVISSHSSETSNVPNTPNAPNSSNTSNAVVVPRSETKTKWTQGGNPIDVSKFDAEIAAAEKNFKAKPKDETAKKSLAKAYVNRGLVLTDARQYASALGDYRKAQRLDPANEDAEKWIAQIIQIYDSLNKESPKEGEEPPPLPFDKNAAANTKQTM